MISRLIALQQGKGKFANGGELSKALKEDNALRQEIEVLTRHFLGRQVTGCINCYTDAYFELLTLSKEKAMEKMETQFALRAGVLLRDVVAQDSSKNMSNANMSNDLALYHLRTNPDCRKFFTKLPDNIDEMLIDKPIVKPIAPKVQRPKKVKK